MTTNLTTNSVTWRRRNKPGAPAMVLQSLALAGLLTLLCYINQTHCTPLASYYVRAPSVWWCCLPRISTGYCPLRYGSDPVLLRRPPSGHPQRSHFESATAQYGRQRASRGRGVSAIITWSLTTAVIGMCYKNNNRNCSWPKARQQSLCLSLFWELCAGVNTECFNLKRNRMLCGYVGAWLPASRC